MRRLLFFLITLIFGVSGFAKEYHVAKTGSDNNKGTLEMPLLTIQAAANLAQPGDIITVHEGIYREEIIPPRGGESAKKPIVYQAATGENVSIRGSERIEKWKNLEGNVWMAELDNSFFGDYNPYKINLSGSWLSYGREHHVGEVYLNGITFYEKFSLDDVKRGCVGSIIENNYIGETNYKNEFGGAETAAIKLHFPIDVIIRDNYCKGVAGLQHRTKGIWLDWGVQNTRVTGNIVTDFQAEGFKLEVGHGPSIVDNNLFINSEIVQWGDAGLFMHNLFYYCSFTFQNDDRIVPYYEPHSTKEAGRGKTLNNYDQYHNNIFIGTGLDGMSGKQIGTRFNHNVFLEGAQKNQHMNSESVVDEVSTNFNFQKGSHPQTISFNVGEKLFGKLYPLITSEYIGELPVPKMAMENPDGTLLDITTDYFGNSIDPKNVMPGPFQNIKKGSNLFEVWPKGSQ